MYHIDKNGKKIVGSTIQELLENYYLESFRIILM